VPSPKSLTDRALQRQASYKVKVKLKLRVSEGGIVVLARITVDVCGVLFGVGFKITCCTFTALVAHRDTLSLF
jgi:hypothetical protein